jgi:hypothetical protein
MSGDQAKRLITRIAANGWRLPAGMVPDAGVAP